MERWAGTPPVIQKGESRVNIHPTKIRTSFVATDCRLCFKIVEHLRHNFGEATMYSQEIALKDHVLKHEAFKEVLNEPAG